LKYLKELLEDIKKNDLKTLQEYIKNNVDDGEAAYCQEQYIKNTTDMEIIADIIVKNPENINNFSRQLTSNEKYEIIKLLNTFTLDNNKNLIRIHTLKLATIISLLPANSYSRDKYFNELNEEEILNLKNTEPLKSKLLSEELEEEILINSANTIFLDWENRFDYFIDIDMNQFYSIKYIIDNLFKEMWKQDPQSVYRRKVIDGQGPNYMEYSFEKLIQEQWEDTLSFLQDKEIF